MRTYSRVILPLIALVIFLNPLAAFSFTKGIYITQYMLENTRAITYIINQAKSVGIDTFIIDVDRQSKRYTQNINLVKNNGINYVARVVVFPNGGFNPQITSQNYWQKIYARANYAISLGANQIQLDYIRYNVSARYSPLNSTNIRQVIKWFKEKVNEHGVPLQVAVFGETTYKPSRVIGQDLPLLSDSVNVFCPMLYPSHFEPFRYYSARPYQTVYESLQALRRQFNGNVPVTVYPYIEMSNYRYPLSPTQKQEYILAQIKAARDAGANGWYAWSPHNEYNNLFAVLRGEKQNN